MKILFICTSNADRSPALENYFRKIKPEHKYLSAGINKYFTEQKNTRYLHQEFIDDADLIVFAEDIHLHILEEKFTLPPAMPFITLNLGEYKQGCISDNYLTKAERILKERIPNF